MNIKIFLIFAFFTITHASTKYELNDLKVLHKEKSYQEYLEHALDIRPSSRNTEWRTMTHSMAIQLIESSIKSHTTNGQTYTLIEGLNKIPILRDSDEYQLKRSQYALKYFKNCTQNCSKQFKQFWTSSKKFQDISFAFYKLFINKGHGLRKLILPEIVVGAGAQVYCKNSSVFKDIVDISVRPKLLDYAKKIYDSVSESCIKSLIPKFREDLYDDNNYISELSYNVLLISKSINTSQEDLYLVKYILNGPVVGDIFNKAWTRLETLSQNFERRKNVLIKLKKLEPMPDSIFNHHDKTKRDVLTNLIAKNFPEYISEYAKKCTEYYAGEKDFLYGNPTPNCEYLMTMKKSKKWISDKIRIKYSSSKKF